jgi:hypothetical protein
MELVTFLLNMLLPPQFSVESHTEIFCCIGIWDLCAIDVDWSLCNPLICKFVMYRCVFVEFNSPLDFFSNSPLYLQSVPIRSANVVKSCTKACRRVLLVLFYS